MKRFTSIISTILFFLKPKRIVAQYKIFSVDEWLEISVLSIIDYVDYVLLVESTISWGNSNLRKNEIESVSALIAKYPKKIIHITGDWDNQTKHVQAGLNYIKKSLPKATHCLYIDSDEIYEKKDITALKKLTSNWKTFNREIRIKMYTYFKSPLYSIDPPEIFMPMVLFPVRHFVEYTGIRAVNLGFIEKTIWLHHMSYVRKNDLEIRNKMITHKNDEGVDVSWYDNVYLNWTPEMKDFHPKQPDLFHSVKVLNKEDVLPDILATYDSWKKQE